MNRSWKQEALKCALQWLPLISAASACDDSVASDGKVDDHELTADSAEGALYGVGADDHEEDEEDGADAVAVDALTSFEVVTSSDAAEQALVALSDASGSQLLDVDLSTGRASNPRSLALDAGETVIAVAARPPTKAPEQALGELLGLGETGMLVSFNRGAPGKARSPVQLSGLAPGESALGIDVRPRGGALYLLGSVGTLYTVDPSTGAATHASSLVADPADLSEPYEGLTDGAVGVGFNPVSDRLRVITGEGLNLRIDVDSGATTTDTAIASRAVGGLAYTNALPGAEATTLYALDAGADQLVRIGGNPASGAGCPGDLGNPNCGKSTDVGALAAGGEVADSTGFDIDAASSSAFAALSLDDAPSSSFYVIDLATGKASLPPGVNNGSIGGGARLRGLTFGKER